MKYVLLEFRIWQRTAFRSFVSVTETQLLSLLYRPINSLYPQYLFLNSRQLICMTIIGHLWYNQHYTWAT